VHYNITTYLLTYLIQYAVLAGSLPACWATATVTAWSPRDQGAAAGPAIGPGPSAVPVQHAATRPVGRRAVHKLASQQTSKSIYSSMLQRPLSHRSKSVSTVL